MPDAVFLGGEEGRFTATELARGPWDPRSQHGGAPAALLAGAFEKLSPDEDLALARITYEFLRPVPLGELALSAQVARPGRRIQLLEGAIESNDGTEVVRARALRIRRADFESAPTSSPPPPGPSAGRVGDFVKPDGEMFATDAMEIRFVAGGFYERGPATAWFRLARPLIAGEQTSSLQRLAAAADFGNGISSEEAWDRHLFINPDLTLYIEREPVGEWICLEARTHLIKGGIGLAHSTLYDERGRVANASQALLVARR